jgi:hypothetical protein
MAGLASFALLGRAQGPSPELWYWHHTYSSTDQAVQWSENLIDRAAAAGYTGVVFADSSFNLMSDSFWPAQNITHLRTVLSYAASKGLKILVTGAPFGHSNDVLQANPNWAESQRIVGAQFRVDSTKTKLQFLNSFPGLVNAGFEAGKTSWFDLKDSAATIDYSVYHSGGRSGVVSNAISNARFRQSIPLKPRRQYHLRLYYKTQNFTGTPYVFLFDASNFSINHLNVPISVKGTRGWTQIDYTFDSQNSTRGYLYFGTWGKTSGKIWFDDLKIEETDLVYVTRRPGTPVRVYDATKTYKEGTDYNYISDPRMTSTRIPFTDQYHAPATITLPAGTHLVPGQTVMVDSYSVFPVPGGETQVGMCLTEPAVLSWLTQNAKTVKTVMPAGAGVFFQYDEMRQMNSCGSCRAKGMTAAQLLAWSVTQSLHTYQSVMPGAPIYVWSDMFDLYHNALKYYANVEGDLTGSWKALPSSVRIMNWNLGNLKSSLTWFSGENSAQPTPHEQIIAGYYDSGNGAASAKTEVAQAAGIPGVMGLMYTTWRDDYSQLEEFADGARAAWPGYAAKFSTAKATTIPSGNAMFVAKHSGKCLSVKGASLVKQTPVVQWSCQDGANQKWRLSENEDGSYEIVSIHSGMALDINGGPTAVANGALAIQWPYWGGKNEKWKLQSTSDGYYSLVVEHSGKCLDVHGGATATGDGVTVDQWTCSGHDNQKWQLVPTS